MSTIKVKFWINAFIPMHVYKKDNTYLTQPRPGHDNQTMIPGPIKGVNDCFSTDNRGFSSDPGASSRLHSEVTITFNKGALVAMDQRHWCNPSKEYDCEDGGLEGTATGSNAQMKFSDPKNGTFEARGVVKQLIPLRNGRFIWHSASLSAATNNPLFAFSPDIDYQGKLQCIIAPGESISVMFNGLVDEFPAYEAYTSLNSGLVKSLFQLPPPPGNTPADLFGKANRSVSGVASWTWPTL